MSDTKDKNRAVKPKTASPVGRGSIGAAIAKACEGQRAGQTYGALGALLKTEFAEARRRALAATKKGDIVAKRLSSFANSVIRALYQEGVKTHPEAAKKVAICAIGGYGRDRIAPHSDIDLLFLHQFRDDEKIKPFLDFVLYPLWDAGLTVGQGVHTPKSAIEFAKGDVIGRTAYLDMRFVAGERAVFDGFASRFDKLRQKSVNKFVQAKLLEQQERHQAAHRSRLLAEPDLKEGRGGLRDLQTMRWLYAYVFKADIAASGVGGGNEILDAAEMKAFLKAEQFFWSVRVQLHDLRDRANEQLSFDIQPALADRLGYAARPGALPAERMMKHYFVNVNEVRRLTRLFTTKLEERIRRRAFTRQSLPKELASDEAAGKPNLALRYGRLDFQSTDDARDNPRDFFRLFRAYSKRPDLGASPWALALIAQNAAAITSKVRRDPVNCALFLAALMKSKAPARTLRVMAEAGLLGKMLPFFGMIAGRVEFGLYRQYPIDEQIFQGIEVLSQIRQGEMEEDHPIATKILQTRQDAAPFYLLVLLYEARFSLKDPSNEDVERFVRREARRLGADEAHANDIAFAATHLRAIMNLVSRRSLLYAPSIAAFARMVATKERLDLLLVLCVCHLRVVSASSWDAWVRGQISVLYHASCIWLEKGDEGLNAWLEAQAKQDRAAAVKALGQWTKAEREFFLSNASDDFLRRIEASQLKRFAALARAADVKGLGAGVDVHVEDGFCEAMVYADDREGLLADLAGAIASIGLGVRRMQALTTPKGKALDLFTLETGEFGASFEDSALLREVHSVLLEAARARREEPFAITKRLGDRRAIFTVTPAVRIDQDASLDCVVVEAEGLDRPGLLHKLAAELTEAKVKIDSAYVVTRGQRAVDAFYLKESDGRKITNAKRLQGIERRLMTVLEEV